MKFRKRLSKFKSKRSFRRGANRTHKFNVQTMRRGGIRM